MAENKKNLFQQLILQPISQQKLRILYIAIALVFLSLSQASLLFLVGPFIKTLFGTGLSQEYIYLNELFPSKLFYFVSGLDQLKINQNQIILAVPLGIVLLGICKSIANYFYNIKPNAAKN